MMGAPEIAIERLPHADGLPLPVYATVGAAGADLHAAVPDDVPVILRPGERAMISTGFAMALPPGYEAQIRPRSGLAAKQGITCLNAPGTIDWDYRGEIKVILINLGPEDISIERGQRIAQMVIAPVVQARFVETGVLDETLRGPGGFGSTGT